MRSAPPAAIRLTQNHDGSITLKELYDYLLLNHAASTPQVYPQNDDDFVIFRYDPSEPLPTGLERSPIMDVTFSDLVLDQDSREITIVHRHAAGAGSLSAGVPPGRRWEFENAQLIYDDSERFSAFGDQEGAVSAGWKQRTLRLDELADDAYGYALVQLVSIDRGKLRVHAGRVLCVLPEEEPPAPTVEISGSFAPETGRELAVFVGHNSPCTLSVAILDEEGQVVERLCHRRSTRPMGLARNPPCTGTASSGTALPPRRARTVSGPRFTGRDRPFRWNRKLLNWNDGLSLLENSVRRPENGGKTDGRDPLL